MADLDNIHVRLGAHMDTALAAFEQHLADIVRRAQDSTIDYLLRHLSIKDGLIEKTAANRRLVRRLDEIFQDQLEEAGLSRMVGAFVTQFPNQLPFVQETLAALAQQAGRKLPAVTFSAADKDLLGSLQSMSADALKDEIAAEATRATTRVLFGVGGLPFKQVVSIVRDGFATTVPKAAALADTLQAGYYRTMLDRQYARIEALDKQEMTYRYSGPRDKRNRPFCAHLMAETQQGQSWTKDQISAMDNGALQPKPVWIFGGGYLCRHQWVPDLAAPAA